MLCDAEQVTLWGGVVGLPPSGQTIALRLCKQFLITSVWLSGDFDPSPRHKWVTGACRAAATGCGCRDADTNAFCNYDAPSQPVPKDITRRSCLFSNWRHFTFQVFWVLVLSVCTNSWRRTCTYLQILNFSHVSFNNLEEAIDVVKYNINMSDPRMEEKLLVLLQHVSGTNLQKTA